MKKLLSILLAALFATAMVSCEKEDTPEETTTGEAAANTLVYNGTVYQMESSYSYEQGGRVYIDAYAVDTTAAGQPIFHIISDDPENGTYNLTEGGIFFGLSSEVEEIQSFSAQGEYFTEGTMVVEKDSTAFSSKLNGTLKDGTKVSYWIYVPADEWEPLPY